MSAVGRDVLSSSERATYDDRNIGVRHVEAFVQNPRRHQDAKFTFPEPLKRVGTLAATNVARQRHDKVFRRDGVCGFVIGDEHEHARVAVATEQFSDLRSLVRAQRDEPS